MNLVTFDQFEGLFVQAETAQIFVRRCGRGTPILLLHGFPETQLMWRSIASILATQFTVVCADLPGYGQTGIPPSRPDHSSSSKRAMAKDLLIVMEKLGFPHFSVGGHDRGGRVGYRLALDYPERIERLAVLDILPVSEVWERADMKLALGYWPWSLLAQPEPLPERLLSLAPGAVIANALADWGSQRDAFSSEVRESYTNALRDPGRLHAICKEYRAAATIDYDHDREDRERGRKIRCPVLILWSKGGPLDTWYFDCGGPLEIWKQWAINVDGKAMEGGHFFPEETSQQTASELIKFFAH